MCFVSVFVFAVEIVNHGGPPGNTTYGLPQWRHPVSSSEARDVLHWMMHPALYRRIPMVIDGRPSLVMDAISATIVVDIGLVESPFQHTCL